jgi:hypothetical protein
MSWGRIRWSGRRLRSGGFSLLPVLVVRLWITRIRSRKTGGKAMGATVHDRLRHINPKKRNRAEAIRLRRQVVHQWLPRFKRDRDDKNKKSLERYKAAVMIDYCTEIVEDLDFFFSERV